MTLSGKGVIIIWNDITPQGRDDFYDWHIHEHIPERLAVPGFRRGSRYIAFSAETKPEFLTLYETSHASIATSAPYLERLNAPTEWTKRATSHFRNTSRALTEVVRSEGAGPGGIMGTIRFYSTEEATVALERILERASELVGTARLPRITGAHICTTNNSASAAKTAESRDRADILTAPIGVILIEGCDATAVKTALSHLLKRCKIESPQIHIGLYALEHVRSR
jgi:hypothetical protein